MDDFGIHHSDLMAHRQMTWQVLKKLEEHGLCLKPEKCEFEKLVIKFLGMIIGNGQVDMDPKKVEAVTAWPTPTMKKQLQQFLGLVNFYRCFVKGFSNIARPLHDLTGSAPWIYDKELLAIIDALLVWRKYLLGAKHVFEIWTDHLNLLFYRQPQNLTRWQARWITDMGEFQFTIHHLPGKANGQADALSRRPDFEPQAPDNQGILGLPEELFHATEITLGGLTEWMAEIRDNTDWEADPVLVQAQSDPKWRRLPEGTALHSGRLYVPATANLRDRIIQGHHDRTLAGHPGSRRTGLILKRSYWWDTLDADVS